MYVVGHLAIFFDMTFSTKLRERWRTSNSLVCVGLDPMPDRFPESVRSSTDPILEFGRAIVDATADSVCAFKPQIAHYSAIGAERALEQTIQHIKKMHPDIPVILDAKRGDVGSTAERYAVEAFDRYQADAVTINPYLGFDSVTPFLKYADKGLVVLCKTSNPSGGDFQDLLVEGKKLYMHIAETVASSWNDNNNCMLVVGGTYPQEMGELRRMVGEIPFLVPGIGAQGGNIAEVVRNGCTADGTGVVINSSRKIIYADSGHDFADAARVAAERLRDEINEQRSKLATR